MSALREIAAVFGVRFDHKELDHGHQSIEHTLHSLEGLAQAIGGSLIVEGIREFVEGIVEASSSLERMSIKLGIGTGDLQELQYAANQFDITADSLGTSLGKLSKALSEARGGSKEAVKAFTEAKVSFKDANGETRSAVDVLPEIADAFVRLKNPSDRAALAMKFFGRNGVELIPMLSKGAEGIRELTEEARALGGGLEEDTIAAANKLEESEKRLNFAFTGLKSRIALGVLPTFIRLTEALVKGVIWLQKVADKSNVVKAVVLGLGAGGLASVLRFIGGLRGLWMWLGRLLIRFAIPVVLIDELITTFEGGDTTIRRILDHWFGEGSTQKVVNWFQTLFDNLSDFERKTNETSSNIEARHGAMWSFLFEAMTYGLGSMTHGWEHFVQSLEDSWTGWKQFFVAVAFYIESQFLSVADSIRNAFVGMWNAILEAGASAIDKISKKLDAIPGLGKIMFGDAAGGLRGLKGDETYRNAISFGQALAAGAQSVSGAQSVAGMQAAIAGLRNADVAAGNIPSIATAPAGRGAITPLYMTNQNEINIEVKGDATEKTARDIGKHTAKGISHGNRAALDSLEQTAEPG